MSILANDQGAYFCFATKTCAVISFSAQTRREEPHVVEKVNGSESDPSRQLFPQHTGIVARALRSATVFLFQIVVVAGIRKIIDLLIP